ncbi:MAG: arginase family protein [Candidatus Omnitrophica bacterium]|nr:arginase family protein [Candidatus Omnitrophota bacterium]MBU1869678.1 arginase family protein [Candidatus Omnitrophota bacterium]
MLNKSVHILNFDDSVIKQRKIFSNYHAEIIDLSRLGPKVRIWANRTTRKTILERIRSIDKGCVTLLGSGDFHHISELLTSRFSEPISLIVFDFHPDWDTLPPRFGCGSWVNAALSNRNIVKCILLGPSSDDIAGWCLRNGCLEFLKNDRLGIYPYEHKPSLLFFRDLPKNSSFDLQKKFFYSKINWKQLQGRDLTGFISDLIKQLPSKKVYLSIDKDCLKKEYSLTNWEEGGFSLDELLLLLKTIKENCDIIAADITGDYSPIAISNKFKAFLSRLDHPKDFSAANIPESQITDVNESTNLKILETLLS